MIRSGPSLCEHVRNCYLRVEKSGKHLLDGGANGAHDDSNVQLKGMLPLVSFLMSQVLLLFFFKHFDLFEPTWVLGDKSAFLEVSDDVSEIFLASKVFDISHQRIVRDAGEGIGHSKLCEMFCTSAGVMVGDVLCIEVLV